MLVCKLLAITKIYDFVLKTTRLKKSNMKQENVALALLLFHNFYLDAVKLCYLACRDNFNIVASVTSTQIVVQNGVGKIFRII